MLPLGDNGELAGLSLLIEPAMDGDRAYRGGVLYAESGVGGTELGSKPSSRRWPGVKAISDRSSWGRIKGRQAIAILTSGSACTAKKVQRTYCFA